MSSTKENHDYRQLHGPPRLFLGMLDECVSDAIIRLRRDGAEYAVGQENAAERRIPCEVAIRVHRDDFFSRVLTQGNLGLGESYINGDFEMAEGELADFLTILLRNRLDRKIKRSPRLALDILRMKLVNQWHGKAGNIHRHYDTGVDLFESFLDRTMTYSCGYAASCNDSLEQLQTNKLERICRKLRLQSGQRLVDIGCGFAGLLIYAAKNYGVSGLGVTLSRDQFERGAANVKTAGLADQIRIDYQDYRHLTGTFDKVVSVGMFEHVPRAEYRHYFGKIHELLTSDGLGLVHVIGSGAASNEHDPFIQKYIFPDSNQPKLSEMAHHLEQNDLAILDVENLKPHYAHTARGWLNRFRQNRSSLDPARYDLKFQRMWEYYLSCAIAAAQASDGALFQVLFTKDYAADIPLRRV